MTWNDGATYDGDWVMGKMHGFGTELRSNGTLRHKGEFKDGLPAGGKYSRLLSISTSPKMTPVREKVLQNNKQSV